MNLATFTAIWQNKYMSFINIEKHGSRFCRLMWLILYVILVMDFHCMCIRLLSTCHSLRVSSCPSWFTYVLICSIWFNMDPKNSSKRLFSWTRLIALLSLLSLYCYLKPKQRMKLKASWLESLIWDCSWHVGVLI